jgi:hypothetical protein
MTDKQKDILEKMIKGSVGPYSNNTAKPLFIAILKDGYLDLISEFSSEWDDYNKAWEAYQNLPLIKALE